MESDSGRESEDLSQTTEYPFFSPENMRRLNRSITRLNAGLCETREPIDE